MATFYLDTSALIKCYALEQGSTWLMNLTDLVHRHDLYTVRITGPEMIAAFQRKVRTKEISQAVATRLSTNFRADWQHRYQLIEVNVAVADRAMNLAEKYSLRGYDAVHLAATLELHDLRLAMQLPALTFISADAEQLTPARAEGLQIENPNHYR